MAKQHRDIVLGNTTITAEEITQAKKAQIKAKLRVAVRDRGFTLARLSVPLPDDVHGEWVPNDPTEIARKKEMGFDIDTEYTTKDSLHNLHPDGTNRGIIGDVVFMTCPKIYYDALGEIAQENFYRTYVKDYQESESYKRLVADTLPEGESGAIVDADRARAIGGQAILDAVKAS